MKTVKMMIMTLLIGGAMTVVTPTVHAGESSQAQTVAVSQPTVKVEGGVVAIHLPGDEPRQLTIYALTGQVVKSMTVQPGTTRVELGAGYYIVKCDRMAQRVVVR